MKPSGNFPIGPKMPGIMDLGCVEAVLKRAGVGVLLVVLAILPSLSATQVLRERIRDGETKMVLEDEAAFKLEITEPTVPQSVEDGLGKKTSQVFQFSVEHRAGVQIPATSLQAGDLLLEPLFLIGPGQDGARVRLLEPGDTVDEQDLVYLQAKSYRQMFDGGGALILPENFAEGDVLDVYSMSYTPDNKLEYIESGFQTHDGLVIIPNGIELEEKHIAMLRYFTPYPVRIRYPVELDLEVYLRVDWPDTSKPEAGQFWVKRAGEPLPLKLFTYQIKEGDRPLKDIITPDRIVIAAKDEPLMEFGSKNSLEAIDRFRNATMLSEGGKPIVSIDPITGDPSDKDGEPGQLMIAPRNAGEYIRPYTMGNVHEVDDLLLTSKLSFAKGFGKDDDKFPFNAHLTHYIIPFEHSCIDGCDARPEISDHVIEGKKGCEQCRRELKFRPFVYDEMEDYPFLDNVWKDHDIDCSYCSLNYRYQTAHALAGDLKMMNEFSPVSLNMIHPSRLRELRMKEGAALAEDVTYYQNGAEVSVDAGTEVSEELRHRLEQRAVSPVYVDAPKGSGYEAAQCPRCYGWNPTPTNTERAKGEMGVDEIRRILACFPLVEGRVNRYDLVIFGLTHEKEVTSGRSKAKVYTFRRYGDEHFKGIRDWKLEKSGWEYLPRYRHESGYSQPNPLRKSLQEDSGDDPFGDDVF